MYNSIRIGYYPIDSGAAIKSAAAAAGGVVHIALPVLLVVLLLVPLPAVDTYFRLLTLLRTRYIMSNAGS